MKNLNNYFLQSKKISSIDDYITEKLRINKDIKVENQHSIATAVEGEEPEFVKRNWIIPAFEWPDSRFTFLRDYCKQILKTEVDLNNDEKTYIKNWIELSKKPLTTEIKHQLVEGDYPKFSGVKFIYDLIQWVYKTDDNITIPRKQKLEKILREINDCTNGKIKSMCWVR